MDQPMDLAAVYLASARGTFAKYREMAEGAFRQVDDAQFFAAPDGGSNSIAVIVKHVAGNMRSRWTDFLTTDGEKPDRDRDGEFESEGDHRAALMEAWNAGWTLAFGELDRLAAEDLTRTVHIRAEPHTVVQAIDRQVTHAAYHVGQIVYLAKHFAGDAWQTLSIPRKQSQPVK
ncbi:MAG: hypothetical protein JWM27_1121 [Gemmatimonadetes bacterium]|nr:hypothetical protein [Gemmatimonadota bacterium]